MVGDGLYSHREDKNQILRSEDRSSSVFKMMHLASLSSCKGGLRPNILAAMTASSHAFSTGEGRKEQEIDGLMDVASAVMC